MSKLSLIKAVELAGGQVALANVIREEVPESKVIQGHVWKWLNLSKEEVPPAEYVIAISRGLGWQITPHELRADLYPNPDDGMPRSLCVCRPAMRESA
jgi:DNA-binding transcriptional regulator YdaS (Cro superfamily)